MLQKWHKIGTKMTWNRISAYVIMISTKNLIKSKNERFREKSWRRFLFAKK